MTSLSFTVHVTPVPKARARVMVGYSFTPKRVRQFEEQVRAGAAAAVAKTPGWRTDHEAGYRVRVAVYREARRGDLDNFLKAATDGMQRTVYDDDKRIVELHGLLFLDKADPRLLVEVIPL